jgi:hypothetical protein
MFEKWYVDLVKEKLKGTGVKVVFFMSYREAILWNLAEIVTIMYAIVFILAAINIAYGAIAGNIGIFVIIVLWSKALNKIKLGVNCWYTPPDEQSEFKKLLDKLNEYDE